MAEHEWTGPVTSTHAGNDVRAGEAHDKVSRSVSEVGMRERQYQRGSWKPGGCGHQSRISACKARCLKRGVSASMSRGRVTKHTTGIAKDSNAESGRDDRRPAFLSRVVELPTGPGAFDALSDALQASIDDEAALRKLFATDKTSPRLNNPHVGLVDVFDAPAAIRTTRARVVKNESDVSAKFILPLSEDRRRKEGTPAMVATLDEFKQKLALFTEGSLSQLTDWKNVVAAGGAVQACLSPVPASAKVSKRALRKHFHNTRIRRRTLTAAEAEKKTQAIYEAVRDSVPWDVTCVRSRHTVSIHSQYPYRAVQIVLRLYRSPRYRSPAEILAGFDVDAPCCAYDGRRVWASPRAIVAMMRQCNTVDMTRRSPSYEIRLAKYSSRHFEVYVPTLRRDDVNPTIFERAISRTQGLGRLLVLENIRNGVARDSYVDARRALRGRPNAQRDWKRHGRKNKGDLKTNLDFTGLEMNDYDTGALHIPYGPGWNARRIDKLVYQTDLGVNSSFNPNNEGHRLHRHPAFFGTISECLEDCCEVNDEPEDDDEKQLQAKEDATYVRGRIQFIEEDPGRQSISGSFNPIHVGEWAEQAYIGATERLFKAIASGNRPAVVALVQEDRAHLDRRDRVGRTPLQVAVLLGLADVVRRMLERSAINGEKAEELKSAAPQMVGGETRMVSSGRGDEHKENGEDDDIHDGSDEGSVVEGHSHDVKVVKVATDVDEAQTSDNESEADVNATDWDFVFTPLQYAILAGSTAVVDLLIVHGADVSLVTVANGWNVHQFDHLTITALTRHERIRGEIARKLIAAGATSSQADENLLTVFHRIVRSGKADLVLTLLRCDPSAKAVVNTPYVDAQARTVYPVVSAIDKGHYSVLAVLLAYKAKLVLGEDDYDHFKTIRKPHTYYANSRDHIDNARTPLEAAAQRRDDVASLLLDAGVDVNAPLSITKGYQSEYTPHHTLLDWIQSATHKARAAQGKPSESDTADDVLEAASTLLELRPTRMTEALHAKINFSGFNHVLAVANWGVNPELFDLLVNKGVSVTDTDHRGWNIFHHFAVHSSEYHAKLIKRALATFPEDVVKKMLMQQSKGLKYTPLALAVKRHHIDMVRILVEAKALPYLLRDVHGMTPLHIAIQEGRPKLTQLLIDAGPVEALYMEDSVGSTPLEVAEVWALRIITHEGFPCRMEIPKACEHNASEQLERCSFDLPTQEREVGRPRAVVSELVKEGYLKAGTKLAMALHAFSERMDAKVSKVRAEQDVLEEAEKTRQAAEGTKGPDERTPEVEEETDVLATLEVVRRAVVARGGAQPRLLAHILDVHKSVEKSLTASASPTCIQVTRKRNNELAPEVEEDVKARLTEGNALSFGGEEMFARVTPFAYEDDMPQE
ncbi:predicted protein [Postia placenta Mad-698-R]|uniref:Uncharacterized protein n=1 Tax=Postia placenta MAD-698-R-SB12 TaxID=670580 RepID=A0A1X6MMT0_9APHY|nr:hypothetical protein POSPLADRAFT_1050124 [Postia placenta MAD-698-R-SB12]EED78996.1 predicted protein [Postia placenta Mad-698-R]OSX57492.1 hypothetical protein POSPLADRAFT_1050124 [Postia placenta MAD-698-R-SB12]